MITFLIGLVILAVGGYFYGGFCQRTFGADDRATPAVTLNNGVDFVPMSKWRNSLIQLLNIAGTGPILGPIQGILFGPVAFLLIPIGNIIGGAMHDYFCGMISMRNSGAQMPDLMNKYLGKKTYVFYNVFVCLLMLLVGSVFIYMPGDLFVTQVLGKSSEPSLTVVVVYAVIFIYYVVATLFPIDKIIGKIYPIFGFLLVLSSVGIFAGIFLKDYQLQEVSLSNIFGSHPSGTPLVPMFFVTVACGIVSGFHSTQSTLIARAVSDEREGRFTFYNMMLVEGFIAMVWAAAAMGIYNIGIDKSLIGTPSVIGLVAKNMLGQLGGLIAILGVIVLPITSGDTALRSLRLMLADFFHIDQIPAKNRLALSAVIFAAVGGILYVAKADPAGFTLLWRYFAWSNQTIAVFAFALITVYLFLKGANGWIALIPGAFYAFIVLSYIANAKIGFNLPLQYAYIVGAVFTVAYVWLVLKASKTDLKDM